MFEATDTDYAPWIVVKSNDKKRARINAMRHLLSKFDYDGKDHDLVGEPDPQIVGARWPTDPTYFLKACRAEADNDDSPPTPGSAELGYVM